MIPLKHIRFFLSVLLATLATAAMADPPTWDPTIPDTTTFEALKVKLLDPNAVNAVLYLDNRCRVLALVVPQEGERSSFAPQFEDISNKGGSANSGTAHYKHTTIVFRSRNGNFLTVSSKMTLAILMHVSLTSSSTRMGFRAPHV